MFVILAIAAIALCLLIAVWLRRMKDQRELVRHSITPDALHALLAANTGAYLRCWPRSTF